MQTLPGSLTKRMILTVLLIGLLTLAAACQSAAEPTPTTTAEAVVEQPVQEAVAVVATWTPLPAVSLVTITAAPTDPPPATATAQPTATLLPVTEDPATETPEATATAEPTAVPTRAATTPQPAQPQAPAQPTALPANPVLGVNLLPNPSFEEGHWNQDGRSELQMPNGWRLEWSESGTGFGDQAWDVYVIPEVRVLPAGQLPPEEHGLFIFDGSHTLKLFKGAGAVNARMLTDIALEPGTYVLEGNFFSDVYENYADKTKYPPQNPEAGESALFAGGGGTGWIGNNYQQRNKLTHTFTLDTAQTIPVGIGFRGRYAIANNGWFVDNMSLRRIQ